ncbi:conserved protein of unknown function [Burkholderia multivorans]
MNSLQISTPARSIKGSYVVHQSDDQFGAVVAYSCYQSSKDAKPHRISESFHDLATRCGRTPPITSKDEGPVFSPFTYAPVAGGTYSARECGFLCFTFENFCPFETQASAILNCVEGIASFIYSTRAHFYCAHRRGNYQLVIALRTPIPAEYYKQVAMRFALRFQGLDVGINSSYMLTHQKIAFPSCTSQRRQHWFRLQTQRGRAFDWLPDLLEAQSALVPRWSVQ